MTFLDNITRSIQFGYELAKLFGDHPERIIVPLLMNPEHWVSDVKDKTTGV